MSIAEIACPSCGWNGRSPGAHARAFRYLEDVTSMRWGEGADASGAPRVDASDQIDDEERGRSPRLLCGECLAEFPLPRGTRIVFV
jgi:hypothetical protein